MHHHQTTILPDNAGYHLAIEALEAQAFGPGRFARTAFRLRENVEHEPELSFVALHSNQVVGSVKQTKILIGNQTALLLGPLVVHPDLKGCGIGGALMQASIQAAQQLGFAATILVGDYPYYVRFGFEKVPAFVLKMPGPVDSDRLLIRHYHECNTSTLIGEVRPYMG